MTKLEYRLRNDINETYNSTINNISIKGNDISETLLLLNSTLWNMFNDINIELNNINN